MWYEWVVESFLEPSSSLQQSGDGLNRDSAFHRDSAESVMGKKKRRVRLGVSEVGSSRESGCVM